MDDLLNRLGRSKPIDRLRYWIFERECIRLHRERGDRRPWTEDPILEKYRFTNVNRKDDRVTRWIAENWLYPHANDEDVWFAMVVARFINWPDTLSELGYPVPWDREHFLKVMDDRKARASGKVTVFGPAYTIHVDQSGRGTAKYLAEDVFSPLWRDRQKMRPRTGETLESYHSRLTAYEGFSGFMAGQVVADLKFIEPLKSAPDWATFAVSGPGSQRGLNRFLGRPVDSKWKEAEWRREFGRLREAIMPDLKNEGFGDLDAQSLQSCLCEFDKYERARLGEGKPRRIYRPHRSGTSDLF